MKLYPLGINGPFPESNGATSGYLLEADGALLQFDLGSGVLARLTAHTPPEGLAALFLTHWHFDHAADLTVLLYRLEALGASLRVFAPVDESSALRRIVSASSSFVLTDVQPGQSFTFGACTVFVGEARHPVPSVGYRVECAGRVFGYTGDTNTLPSLASFYKGCHLLLADGLFPTAAWAEGKPHLSAALAASLAAEAGAGRLLVTHLNPLFPPDTLLQEARDVFPAVSLARPGVVEDV